MSLGERITELRNQNNLSQYQLAQAMEVSRQAVSKWENDQSSPDAQNLIRLAEILDTDIEYLTTGRRSFGMRPPVVITATETVEKVVEKPVIVEKVVKQIVEKSIVEFVEKPVVKKVIRTRYIRNPMEYCVVGVLCFLLGMIVGWILL